MNTDLRDATAALYTELFRSYNLTAALVAMNKGKAFSEYDYKFYPAELLFCMAFQRYVSDSTPEELQHRENEIVAEIVRPHGGHIELAMDARERARRMLKDHPTYFRHLRNKFLMIDRFPANEGRFPLTLEDCTASDSTVPPSARTT